MVCEGEGGNCEKSFYGAVLHDLERPIRMDLRLVEEEIITNSGRRIYEYFPLYEILPLC